MTNKFNLGSILLFSLSILLFVIMVVGIAVNLHDYYQHPLENSAPFSAVYLYFGAIFGVPAIAASGLALFFKNKARN